MAQLSDKSRARCAYVYDVFAAGSGGTTYVGNR